MIEHSLYDSMIADVLQPDYKKRRKDLYDRVVGKYQPTNPLLVLFANAEIENQRFIQDPTFYYYTGVEIQGACLIIDAQGNQKLFVPKFPESRKLWEVDEDISSDDAVKMGFVQLDVTGQTIKGFSISFRFSLPDYQNVIEILSAHVLGGGQIFAFLPDKGIASLTHLMWDRMFHFAPSLISAMSDMSDVIVAMRRKKDMYEIQTMYKAVEITAQAQQAAAHIITPGVNEADVQAGIEFIYTQNFARPAFPSIVGSGKQSTILHYRSNNNEIKKNELVVVDIGACYQYYCADITRTYPSDKKFTQQQKDLYSIVLEAQLYAAQLAKPGMYLHSAAHPEFSLHHKVVEFFNAKKYAKYFPHGLGHFIGLDVHDVGGREQILEIGDVITIEPGIYIPEKNMGVRIEDNYWVIEDEAICLSENLPKNPEEIESFMEQSLD